MNNDDAEVAFGSSNIFHIEEIWELANEKGNEEKEIDVIEDIKNS